MCLVPAGEEQAPKRSPQSGPQVPALFLPRASFPREQSAGSVCLASMWLDQVGGCVFHRMCLDLSSVVSIEEHRREKPSSLHVHLVRGPFTMSVPASVGTQRCREEPGTQTEVWFLAQANPCSAPKGTPGTWTPSVHRRKACEEAAPPAARGGSGGLGSRLGGQGAGADRGPQEPGLRPGDPSPAGMDSPGGRAVRLLRLHPTCTRSATDFRTDKASALWVPAPQGQMPAWGHSFCGPEHQRAWRAVPRASPAAPGKAPGGRAPSPCPPPPSTLLVQTAELGAADRDRTSLHPPDLPNDQSRQPGPVT